MVMRSYVLKHKEPSGNFHEFWTSSLISWYNQLMEKRKKVGLLGGNFNPIHHAHLMIADQVAQRLNLDIVLLMPENIPPHVDVKETIDAVHRVKMLELAVKDNPRLGLEICEIKRGGKSYTYDTLSALTKLHPECDFYFIIGSDMVDYLPKWYKIDELIHLVTFVAIKRSETINPTPYPVRWIDVPLLPISSTQIRELIAADIEPTYLLPKSVIDYIKIQKLYQKKHD